jgi:hypothetical protein
MPKSVNNKLHLSEIRMAWNQFYRRYPPGVATRDQFLLKAVRAWNPIDIQDPALLRRLLAQMQVAHLGLRLLEAALDKTGLEPLGFCSPWA